VQLPFTARRDQPVAGQNLQDVVPPRPLAAAWQPLGPEAIEFEFAPQLTGQPAGPPLPRTAQPHLGQADLHAIDVGGNQRAFFGKQRQCACLAGGLVDHLNGAAPGEQLRRIDFSQIQHLTLDDAAIGETLVLDDVPIDMRLSVLFAFGRSQEHGDLLLSTERDSRKQTRSSLQPILAYLPCP